MVSRARFDSCKCSPILGSQIPHSLRIEPHVGRFLRVFEDGGADQFIFCGPENDVARGMIPVRAKISRLVSKSSRFAVLKALVCICTRKLGVPERITTSNPSPDHEFQEPRSYGPSTPVFLLRICQSSPVLPQRQSFRSEITMAQDGEPPKSVDKGKGKAVDGEASKAEEVKKDKDGKPLVNGKQEDEKIGGRVTASSLVVLLTGPSSAGRA
jgi:hypothetical protein